MWNAALRRVVRDEEEREREKRAAAQLRLRRDAQQQQQQEAAGVNSTVAVVTSSSTIESSSTTDNNADNENENENEEEEEEEEDDVQRHLLSRPKSSWSCLEDSQQAFCLAMNRQRSVFAVGEREGRLSIWDNVAMRVITRELDPTLVVVPEPEAGDSAAGGGEGPVLEAREAPEATEPTQEREATSSGDDATPDDGGDDESAANDDGSVGAEDDEEDDDEGDEDEDDEGDEEEDNNTEEEEEEEDGDVDDDVEEDDDKKATGKKRVLSSDPASPAAAAALSAADDAPQDPTLSHPLTVAAGSAANGGDSSSSSRVRGGLSLEELRVVKTSLKVVTCCAWSCDTRWLFAGCEEKGNRRGRLCVWDVAAASIFATFSFDAPINYVSAHPGEPDVVLVSSHNALPVRLNVRTRVATRLEHVPTANPTLHTTVPANSRHPSLVVAAKFGTTGAWIYCVSSKSTVAILDSATLACVHSATLSVVVQFIDVSVDYRETALLLTSAKGVHEFAIRTTEPDAVADADTSGGDASSSPSSLSPSLSSLSPSSSSTRTLSEVRLYSTGAVRAPWALCCFSDDERFVVGLPVVRHRHVGESGLYTWNRASGKAQHNAGVKDGVNALVWDPRRDSILAVSTTGALFVFEEEFTTTWSGPMYPAGYRLITDNELHAAAMDAEVAAAESAKRAATAAALAEDDAIDVFTIDEAPTIGPASAQRPPMAHLVTRLEPAVANELVYIPAIPIAHHHRKHHHAFHGGHAYNEEKHFGLGQSIFEPLKVAAKPKPSRPKKKGPTVAALAGASAGGDAVAAATNAKKRVRSSSGSQKRRRR
ncbi:hypothetical protein PybrP1_003355 [[Pythium] brassicae (nom. inval.)]|nr:hypothetical protein PybrP1_003355 [[Pythium] brassicae (nom. inval.)]